MCNRSALIGAIVFVWLPNEGAPTQPGPKFRPVYILDVADGRAKVAYGTSQRTREIFRGEFLISHSEFPQLAKDTKFSLRKHYWIPLNEAFFTRHGKLVSLGRLTPELSQRVVTAAEEIGMIE